MLPESVGPKIIPHLLWCRPLYYTTPCDLSDSSIPSIAPNLINISHSGHVATCLASCPPSPVPGPFSLHFPTIYEKFVGYRTGVHSPFPNLTPLLFRIAVPHHCHPPEGARQCMVNHELLTLSDTGCGDILQNYHTPKVEVGPEFILGKLCIKDD